MFGSTQFSRLWTLSDVQHTWGKHFFFFSVNNISPNWIYFPLPSRVLFLACQYTSSLVFVSVYFAVSKVHYINETTYRINVHYGVIYRCYFTTKLFALPLSLQVTSIESLHPSWSCYVWQHAVSVAMLSELQRWETARRTVFLHFKLPECVCVRQNGRSDDLKWRLGTLGYKASPSACWHVLVDSTVTCSSSENCWKRIRKTYVIL